MSSSFTEALLSRSKAINLEKRCDGMAGHVRRMLLIVFLCSETKASWLHVKQERITSARKSMTGKNQTKEGEGKASAPHSHLQSKRRKNLHFDTRRGPFHCEKLKNQEDLNELNFSQLVASLGHLYMSLTHSFFFLVKKDGKSRCHVARKKSQSQRQRGHVRDAEGRSAGLPLALNISPCPKKSRKKPASRSVPSLLVETRFTWEPQTVTLQSDTLAGRTNHSFNALSSMQ